MILELSRGQNKTNTAQRQFLLQQTKKHPGCRPEFVCFPNRQRLFLLKLFQITNSENILAHPIEYLKGVGPQRADLLKKELGIFTFNDLLHHFPYRHIDKTKVLKIGELNAATEFAQVRGVLLYSDILGEKSAKRLIAYLKDDTGTIELTWFKGLTWVQKT